MLTHHRPRAPGRLQRAIYQLRTEGSGSRARDAWTIGIGLFIGCSPLIGFHLGIALLVGWLLGLNRVKLYLAANLMNPLILPGIFFAEVQTGAWLRQGHAYPITTDIFHTLEPWHFGLDLLIGSLIIGAAIGAFGGLMTFLAFGRSLRDPAFTALVKEASDRYLASGITAWEFARGKLRNDPAYRQVVTGGLLPTHGRLLDIGCGQGLLLALIAAARAAGRAGTWPAEWAAAPVDLELTGIELRPRIARIASEALGDAASIHQADVRALPVASTEIIALFDVLHLMSAPEQESLLTVLVAALTPGGALLVREADAAGGWRFHAVRFGNRLTAIVTRRWRTRFHFRTAAEWHTLLERYDLDVADVRPAGGGTPFANILLVARKRA
jgi:uncharacterized protein (DUF2062 family)/2-polyprenyl-3-methyl-5-hydroxy-6-metoxy-1,4-benzoquinol methylase